MTILRIPDPSLVVLVGAAVPAAQTVMLDIADRLPAEERQKMVRRSR
ncbi:MAG: hypothetical protein ACTS8Z_04065 [Candidatus Limnocylindrales bacterium]